MNLSLCAELIIIKVLLGSTKQSSCVMRLAYQSVCLSVCLSVCQSLLLSKNCSKDFEKIPVQCKQLVFYNYHQNGCNDFCILCLFGTIFKNSRRGIKQNCDFQCVVWSYFMICLICRVLVRRNIQKLFLLLAPPNLLITGRRIYPFNRGTRIYRECAIPLTR